MVKLLLRLELILKVPQGILSTDTVHQAQSRAAHRPALTVALAHRAVAGEGAEFGDGAGQYAALLFLRG